MKTRFKFKCGYLNRVWFDVYDETGAFEVEYRHRTCDYERKIYNGDYDAEQGPLVGYLQPETYDRTVDLRLVEAWNEFQREERARFVALLEASPERYGELPANDPLRQPQFIAVGAANYKDGKWSLEQLAS